MNQVLLYSIITLSAIGAIAGIVLYIVAQKFKVQEDPRIDEITEKLPGANCGGCGFAGCRNFAEAIVNAGNMDELNCPVGGNALIKEIAPILGVSTVEKEPMIAVVRCNGSKRNAQQKVIYDSASTCGFAHSLFSGESGCPNGCLGLGDCVLSCKFDAIYIDEITGLPIVSNEKCVACGACVKVCPRNIIELRNKGKKERRIYVSCINTEKGAIAKKNCEVACIGCGKCEKTCPYEAITLKNNLAYIDFAKCKLCRKCVEVCPTSAIVELNFPPRKEKSESKLEENTVL